MRSFEHVRGHLAAAGFRLTLQEPYVACVELSLQVEACPVPPAEDEALADDAPLTDAERPAPLVQLRIAADRDCASVSAASILAKVARDARMVELDAEAPDYGWASNKGYGAAVHRAAIDRIGAVEGVERTQSSIILSTKFER